MAESRQSLPIFGSSDGDSNKQETSVLPDDVTKCLYKSRFLHLATTAASEPDIALMNYTFFASTPFSPTAPVIVMTTNPRSNKTNNLLANPSVSLLVHDWVSPRTPVVGGLSAQGRATGLSDFMSFMTALAPARISAKLRGTARLAEPGSDEEGFYLRKHLDNLQTASETPVSVGAGARVIVVDVKGVRVSDLAGTVKDWVIVPAAVE